MKVIVNTNVLVSAILRDNIAERVIMSIVMQPIENGFYSENSKILSVLIQTANSSNNEFNT